MHVAYIEVIFHLFEHIYNCLLLKCNSITPKSGPVWGIQQVIFPVWLKIIAFRLRPLLEQPQNFVWGYNWIQNYYLLLFDADITLPISRVAPWLWTWRLFAKTMEAKELPDDWKTGTISAIFKKGNKQNSANYRPVSLMCVICKVMESIIRDSLMNHLLDNNLLGVLMMMMMMMMMMVIYIYIYICMYGRRQPAWVL